MICRGKDTDAATSVGVPIAPVIPPDPVDPPQRSLADLLLDGSDSGVLACDERGVVRVVNAAATRLVPGLRVGELLAAAGPAALTADSGAGAAQVDLDLDGRFLAARRQPLPDGWTAWHIQDVTEQHTRMDSLLAERARSRFLAAASRRLGLSLHPGRTARTVAELAVAELADAAVVVRPVQTGVVEWVRCERAGPPTSGRLAVADLPAPVADALSGLEDGPRPLPVEHAEIPWTPPPSSGPLQAAVMPLPGNGVPAGALVLVRREGEAAAVEGVDAALAEEFAQRGGIALAAAALYAQQARTAAVLKRSLLQPSLPTLPGMTFGAAYRPAEQGLLIGGDFYDVHPDPGGRVMFLLGDVCGKGVDAAVSTGQLRQSVQALRRLERDPVRLLELLNATMLETMPEDADPSFATVVLGAATPTAGGGLRLELAGGGHQPPLIVRRDGVEMVEIGGMLVGAVPSARFRSRTVDLAPGEACVLYTDGVTEARGGPDGRQTFDEQRVADLLSGCHVMPAPAIAERVELHTTRWLASGHHDDIAVLVIQAPLPASPPRTGSTRRHLHSVQPTRPDPSAEETA